MTAHGAVNMRVVGMVLQQIETVFTALSAVEFYAHDLTYCGTTVRQLRTRHYNGTETTVQNLRSAVSGV
jgi:hypothetical protein